ncbi:hypothetical protein [Bacillus thuringiensis]|uniref:hypothetical protein n=1 Tax=Bacillus thuringiensis TaxID=1428 RepID=UPI0015C512EA|nr:hypothetical protein [Bacillus thuringiensis]
MDLKKSIIEYFRLIHNRDCHREWSEAWNGIDSKARELEEQITELIESENQN